MTMSRTFAGGQSLLKQLRERSTSAALLLDISGLAELTFFNQSAQSLELGALTSLAQLASDPQVEAHTAALSEAARRVGDVQIRARATLGGNLLSGWASDLGVILIASGATVAICTRDGTRTLEVAQRLQRVFKIDIETCDHCGGAVKVIASIEDPAVIKKILEHLERRAQAAPPAFRPFARAPPQALLPGLTEPG